MTNPSLEHDKYSRVEVSSVREQLQLERLKKQEKALIDEINNETITLLNSIQTALIKLHSKQK